MLMKSVVFFHVSLFGIAMRLCLRFFPGRWPPLFSVINFVARNTAKYVGYGYYLYMYW